MYLNNAEKVDIGAISLILFQLTRARILEFYIILAVYSNNPRYWSFVALIGSRTIGKIKE